jgi:hypothetical protein
MARLCSVSRWRAGLGLAQEPPEVVNLHALVPKHLGEGVVLLLGPLGPEHVVEEQLADVPRSQPGQLEAGPVHDDLAKLADLRLDVEVHRDLRSDGQACGVAGSSAGLSSGTGTWPVSSRARPQARQ